MRPLKHQGLVIILTYALTQVSYENISLSQRSELPTVVHLVSGLMENLLHWKDAPRMIFSQYWNSEHVTILTFGLGKGQIQINLMQLNYLKLGAGH